MPIASRGFSPCFALMDGWVLVCWCVGFEFDCGCDPILMPLSGVKMKLPFWKGGKRERKFNEGGLDEAFYLQDRRHGADEDDQRLCEVVVCASLVESGLARVGMHRW